MILVGQPQTFSMVAASLNLWRSCGEVMHKPLPWFRLYGEIVSDPKVQLLDFADQRHFVMVLALKCNGTLDAQYPNAEFRAKAISKALGLTHEEGSQVVDRLCENGLVNNDWQPRKWEERRFISDHSAERTKRWRDGKKQSSNTLPNVTVTGSNRHSDGDVTAKIQSQIQNQIHNQNQTIRSDNDDKGNSDEIARQNIVKLKRIIAPMAKKLTE